MNRQTRCEGKSTTMSAVAYGYITLSGYGVHSVGIKGAVEFHIKIGKKISSHRAIRPCVWKSVFYMAFWMARSGNAASSSKENRINKRSSEIPVINLDNIEEYLNRGFIDDTNIHQQEEYTERADQILIKLQEDNKDQEKPEEKRRKLCDHLKTLFHQRLWYSSSNPRRPITQVTCKVNPQERDHFNTYIPTVWIVALLRPQEHKIVIHGAPSLLR